MSTPFVRFICISIEVIVGLFCCISSYAQSVEVFQNVHMYSFTVDDGLSQSNASKVIKDSQGFIWVGTNNGLSRFDGYKFKVYRNDPNDSSSLGSNHIFFVFEDSKKRLWVGTNLSGLNLYDRTSDTFIKYNHNPEDNNTLSQASAVSICEARDGHLWIGTYWGLNKFNPETEQFTRFYHGSPEMYGLINNAVYSIIEDHSGNIWTGTGDGVTVLHPLNDVDYVMSHFQHDADQLGTLSSSDINVVYEDKDFNLWIGTGNGPNKFVWPNAEQQFKFDHPARNKLNDPSRGYFRSYTAKQFGENLSEGIVLEIENFDDSLLVMTVDGGGIHLVSSNEKYLGKIKSSNDVTFDQITAHDIYFEGENAWVGTHAKGLKLFSTSKKSFKHLESLGFDDISLRNNSVLDLAESEDGHIWIGTDGSGLIDYDPVADTYKHYLHDANDPLSISSNVVKSLEFDDVQNLYVGTYDGGLNYLNRQTDEFHHYFHNPKDPTSIRNNSVWSLHIDGRKRIWVGTLSGLDLLDVHTGTFKHYYNDYNDPKTIKLGAIFRIAEDSTGNLWFSSISEGVCKYVEHTDQFRNYNQGVDEIDEIITNDVRDILVTKDGDVVLATGLGLSSYNSELDIFESLNTPGVLENTIQSVLRDSVGTYWMGTFDGIYTANSSLNTIRSYDLSDGVQGREFNYDAKLITSDGKFYLGGLNGLNIFDPTQIGDNTKVPPVAITGLRLFHQTVEPGDKTGILYTDISQQKKISLSYEQDLITFDFAALDYHFPKRNEYAYIMEGFDRDWNYVGTSTSATYTNLTPGNYVFRVIASNKDDYWNRDGASLIISIKPPFWMTAWFRLLLVLSLVGVIIGIIRLRTYRVTRRNKLLEDKVKERTESLAKTNTILSKEIEVREAAQRDLQQAIKVSEAANRAKSDFLANMSHEIRTPVNGIIGMTELVLNSELTRQQSKYLEVVRKSGDSLLDIINDILDISRIEAGKLQVQKVRFDLLSVVENVIAEIAILAFNKGLNLTYKFGNSVPAYVVGDSVRMKQILTNLLNNAVKFTEQGSIFLEVRNMFHSSEASTIHLEFLVKDSGIGIPEDRIHSIFETFTQVDSSSTRKFEGSGLGLAISKHLIEMMGGSIAVNSQLGAGSEFRFSLMLPIAEAVTKPIFLGHLSWRTRHILVVDPNVMCALYFQEMMQSWGAQVDYVSEITQEQLQSKVAYDFIFIDEPNVSEELLSSLDRELPKSKVVIVGALNGSSSAWKRDQLYVNRPIMMSEIFLLIAEHFSSELVKDQNEETVEPIKDVFDYKVLLVEDNPTNQLVFRQMFGSLKLKVTCANNGAEAVDYYEQEHFDIIFMDIQMPVMDGYEATAQIRKFANGLEVPIVALTANAMEGTKEECLSKGMNAFLTKPLKMVDLKKTLVEWLE